MSMPFCPKSYVFDVFLHSSYKSDVLHMFLYILTCFVYFCTFCMFLYVFVHFLWNRMVLYVFVFFLWNHMFFVCVCMFLYFFHKKKNNKKQVFLENIQQMFKNLNFATNVGQLRKISANCGNKCGNNG